MSNSQFFNKKEAAAFLQISRTTLDKWIASGRLPPRQLTPATYRWTAAELLAARHHRGEADNPALHVGHALQPRGKRNGLLSSLMSAHKRS